MSIVNILNNKRILIWGYGREGQSTQHFLTKFVDAASVDIFEGKRDEIDEEAYDYIIKSPGIPMDDDNPKYISQTELFLQEYRDKVIGITGTKGKSTTSAMMYHVLSKCLNKKIIFLGNIGEPCMDYFGEIDDDTIIVFEMSCHQLAHVSVSPHIAVFLNLYEEHLDYYKSMDKYFRAKANITKHQTEKDFFFVGSNVPLIETRAKTKVMENLQADNYQLKVLGDHNNYNAEYVFTIATSLFNLESAAVKEALKSFNGLPHRLQFVGNIDGIDYYDDSISTIPNATISALLSVPNSETVLIGGMDRGIDYSVLIEFIKNHSEYQYIMAYDSGKRIYEEVKHYDYCHYEKDLELSVAKAKSITKKGKACILSPASASYGYFKNFEQRGEIFQSYLH